MEQRYVARLVLGGALMVTFPYVTATLAVFVACLHAVGLLMILSSHPSQKLYSPGHARRSELDAELEELGRVIPFALRGYHYLVLELVDNHTNGRRRRAAMRSYDGRLERIEL